MKIFPKFLLVTSLMVVLSVCGGNAVATQEGDLVSVAYTKAAMTISAQISTNTPSATVTPLPLIIPTLYVPPTFAEVASPTTQSVTSYASYSTANGCNDSIYVSDVTIPDGTVISPGAAFTKTWRLQNAGTTTWTTSYSLVFISGEQMGTTTSVPVSQSVAPGAQIDLSVDMVAPTNTGSYQGYWKMKNASGQYFDDSVYVLITVGSGGATQPSVTNTPGPSPTATSTGIPSNPISNLSMSVDPDYNPGSCPYTFSFAATFTLNQGATLTYGLEAGSETPGFQFDLPGAQTSTFGPGTYTLTFPLEFTDSGTGWVRFHVTSPVDVRSNQATFDLTCTP